MGSSFLHLLDTHPPLALRIRALEPDFDGRFVPVLPLDATALALAPGQDQDFASRRSPSPARAGGGFFAPPPFAAHAAMSGAGNLTTAHLRYAEELRNAISPALQAAAREPLGACALIYALLLSDDAPARARQLEELAGATAASTCQETLRLLPEVQAVAAHAKLPLVNLALPGLRALSAGQYRQFHAALQALVAGDSEIDLFEYMLQKTVLRHLDSHFSGARKPVIEYYALKPLLPDCAILLSGLAHLGQDTAEEIEFAFAQGAQLLSAVAQADLDLVAAEQCGLAQIDAALARLAQAAPQIKKNVLQACAQTVAADGLIREAEAELLRAIADSLDCPLPPFVAKIESPPEPAAASEPSG
jgi:hypothetical protein